MPTRLQILHASDFEAGIPAIDDAVRFSAILNYFRTSNSGLFATPADVLPNTLTLSSGDNYLPGPFFNASSDPALNNIGGLRSSSTPTPGRADIGILNAIGIQAAAFGNHEFDLGTAQVSTLLGTSSGNPGTKFPYLSSNLNFAPDSNLSSLVATNPTTAEANTLGGKIAESTVITLANGERIGIVGATTPTLRNISSPGQVGVLPANATDFAALAAEIQTTVNVLTQQGINKIILLAHMQQLNIERDELAPRLRDVDIIIAGGSHTPLLDSNDVARSGSTPVAGYPIARKDANNQDVLVLNTDANYRYVGRLIVEFSDNGTLNLNSLNDTLNGAFATDDAGVDRVYGSDVVPRNVADPNVVAITDALRTVVSGKDSLITGKTDFFLNGTRDEVRTQETNLGNVSADANIAYARQVDPSVVISLKNGGGIRDNIGAVTGSAGATNASDIQKLPPQPNPLAPNKQVGDVTQLDIENSLRFNNSLSLITVTAQQLLQILEHGVSQTASGATPGRFPQVGGMIFSFDPARAAAEDVNGNGVLNPGEDRNNNGVLDAGQRIRSLAITNDDDKVTDIVVQDGAIVGDPNRTFRMVTLSFLAGTNATDAAGGDSYPFPQFVRANAGLANRIDLQGETTADLNGNGTIDAAVTIAAGRYTFAAAGSEQDALAEYLGQIGTYDQQDTPVAQDTRIQNLSARTDAVLNADRSFRGSNRADRLLGAAGDDILVGFAGNDNLQGFEGNDDLEGSSGSDTLSGGTGNDEFRGGSGSDTVRGAAGNDTLYGGGGSDLLDGGDGRDISVLERGRGSDTIRGFRDRQDRLGLSRGLRFNQLEIEQVGGRTEISFGNDLLATLLGVNASRITSADFTTRF
ncbi:MAG: bifunctional metallophosphatase/5'-nucleotidase [Cyanobacteria bacterium CRU_2_1]|nr:bifunctional metallophosphatase/5'-nucleotidase [Cyanobacteria bacterium RU_5_0]NJR58227.1 bifunctional metallophosphatase/5'-nucleotidase [Cyanobacteria bacterium CRU_2_1]